MYLVMDSNIFRRVERYRISLHDMSQYPFESLMLQPHLRKPGNKASSLNRVLATPKNFTVEYLKPPYATMCVDYEPMKFQNKHHCVHSCVTNRTFEQFAKYPYSAFIMDSVSEKLVSYNDINKPDVAKKTDSIVKDCQSKGKCHSRSWKTQAITTLLNIVNEVGNDFMIAIALPLGPWTYIEHEPSLKFVTYMTFLLGSFGTWTGVSILGLSPFKMIIRKNLKTRDSRGTDDSVSVMDLRKSITRVDVATSVSE